MRLSDLLLQACRSANIGAPSSLASLKPNEELMLQFIDQAHREILSSRDWYFMQRTGAFTCLAYASSTATITSGVITAAGAPFTTALTVNGKITIDDSSGYKNDVIRINATGTGTVTIVSNWPRGDCAGTYYYGQDEYALASDCDKVSWMMTHNVGAATLGTVILQPKSVQEMEAIKTNRASYITPGQPFWYCIKRTGTTTDHIRTVVLDPFPVVKSTIYYGYYKKPTTLVTTTDCFPDLPDRWDDILLDLALEKYCASLGMGSSNDQSAQMRLQLVAQDAAAGMAEVASVQPSIGQDRPTFDPASVSRTFYEGQYGGSW
jgi:hypothetical protein